MKLLRFSLVGLLSLLKPIATQSFTSSSQNAPSLRSGGLSPSRQQRTLRYSGMWSQDSDLEGADKLKACVPYILPILDGDHFGHYIFERIPPLGLVHDVLFGGMLEFWEAFPFAGLVLFIALTLGTRGNTEMNRNVRFSAQQAALIDVSLVAPELVAAAFEGEDMPRQLMEPCSNFTYYYILAAVAYCITQNLRGKKPDQIPYISDFSDVMVGPF